MWFQRSICITREINSTFVFLSLINYYYVLFMLHLINDKIVTFELAAYTQPYCERFLCV